MNEKETFKDIEGFEGYYKISNRGRVMSVGYSKCGHCGRQGKQGKFLACPVMKNGYKMCTLSMPGEKGQIRKTFSVHRLVAFAFLGKPKGKAFVINHKDGNKTNNIVSNLEWSTASEMTKDAAHKLFGPSLPQR